MAVAVQADLMAGVADLRGHEWSPGHHPAKKEEGGVNVAAFQQTQEVWCGQWIRTVIEGERHMLGCPDTGEPGQQLVSKRWP
jgi:hypothetical protein